ncbi:MAG: NAD-dependent epimerase/dehydratase family protein [Steroidobacteraceae bacterium]
MKIVITGGDGFIGQALVKRLLTPAGEQQIGGKPTRITVLDMRVSSKYQDPRVVALEGSIADKELLNKAIGDGVDMFFHLASIPGGAAEQNFDLGLQVNLYATINILEALRALNTKPRLVFASTIAVYTNRPTELIDENTLPDPFLSYGTHKLMGEYLVSDYSRKGFIDGVSVRIPGIVARPPVAAGLLSAFLSDIITSLSSGKSFVCPVSAQGTSWFASRECMVDNLLHASVLPAEVAAKQRTWQMPVLRLSLGELVQAIASIYGQDVLSRVTYEPNEKLEAGFARQPPLNVPKSLAAGFRTDGDAVTLVKRALQGL